MTVEMAFWLALASLATTCVAAIGARSLSEFSRHELEDICRRRRQLDRLGVILRKHDSAAVGAETLQVLATAVMIGAGGYWLWEASHTPGRSVGATFGSGSAVAAVLLLSAEIWIPRAVARLWAVPIVHFTWSVWRAISLVLLPLVFCGRFVETFLQRAAGRTIEQPDEESFEDEIRSIVTEGHREGLLEGDAREMIEGVMELSDVDVSEVMTPRTDMISISASLDWTELLDFVVQASHTRIPVCGENRDDIIGILYTKDLIPELAKPTSREPRPWNALLRDPYFVPETKPVDVLLQEFQRTHTHIAVVLDEYGGVCGLVTLEDVLEEIVGEIVDEYDGDLVDGISQIEEGISEVLGKVHLDEVNQRLAVELPEEEEYDTIAGFVFSELGHMPVQGEEVLYQNLRLTVLEATTRRIERVRLEILDESTAKE